MVRPGHLPAAWKRPENANVTLNWPSALTQWRSESIELAQGEGYLAAGHGYLGWSGLKGTFVLVSVSPLYFLNLSVSVQIGRITFNKRFRFGCESAFAFPFSFALAMHI